MAIDQVRACDQFVKIADNVDAPKRKLKNGEQRQPV
jgi:hypothetical protein